MINVSFHLQNIHNIYKKYTKFMYKIYDIKQDL